MALEGWKGEMGGEGEKWKGGSSVAAFFAYFYLGFGAVGAFGVVEDRRIGGSDRDV